MVAEYCKRRGNIKMTAGNMQYMLSGCHFIRNKKGSGHPPLDLRSHYLLCYNSKERNL